MANLTGTTLKNRYQIVESLGRGGMAEVYKVWDHHRQTHLAAKILRDDLAHDVVFLRRFEREAKTLTRLQHTHIVRSYGIEQDGLHVFLLMEFIEGFTLRELIFQSRLTGFKLDDAIRIMRPVCSALYYAHQMGIVHCDLKPGNILMDASGKVFVSDFGIARHIDTATMTMVGVGTPAYMAPELVRGHDPTPQSDIYALGVMMYEMLSGGERPFTGDRASITGTTTEKVRWEQVHSPPTLLRTYKPHIPSQVESLVMRCLEKAPKNRFLSCSDLNKALSIFEGQEEIIREQERQARLRAEQLEMQKREEVQRQAAERRAQEKARQEVEERAAREQARLEQARLKAEQIERQIREAAEKKAAEERAREEARRQVRLKAEELERLRVDLARQKAEQEAKRKQEKEKQKREKRAAQAAAREKRARIKKEEKAALATEKKEKDAEANKEGQRKGWNLQRVMLVGGIVLLMLGWVAIVLVGGQLWGEFRQRGAKNAGSIIGATETPLPKATVQPTAIPTIEPTASLSVGSRIESPVDGMVQLYIPSGEFIMGLDESDPLGNFYEKPSRSVYLDAFWIDRTEVDNSKYQQCVESGACTPPSVTRSNTRTDYFYNPEFKDYPVIYVTWFQAQEYCNWAGRRLPTEAEWEKAARGTDGRIYPWGNDDPNVGLLNYRTDSGDTTPVENYLEGASPYGALNMAGNVSEWVSDWLDNNYYRNSPIENPKGPAEGRYRVTRGGAWYFYQYHYYAAGRGGQYPTYARSYIGFRCAMDEAE